jgi:membrane protein
VLFISGKVVIGAYVGRTSVSTAFGAAASLVVVLLWVYYSAQVFLFGAEFTWVYCHRFGSRRGQPLPGVTLPRPDVAGTASG